MILLQVTLAVRYRPLHSTKLSGVHGLPALHLQSAVAKRLDV